MGQKFVPRRSVMSVPHLVFVEDTKSVSCSSCPEHDFASYERAFAHSVRHCGFCINLYPVSNNDHMPITECHKQKSHNACLSLFVYGAVIIIHEQVILNGIESTQTKFMCNFRNGDKCCGKIFDNVNNLNQHIAKKYGNSKKTRSIKPIVNKIVKDENFQYCQEKIYNFESVAPIKSNALYSQSRADVFWPQLKLKNLISPKTLANDKFISKIVGFDINVLKSMTDGWKKSNQKKTIPPKQIGIFVPQLLPHIPTVES